MRKLRSLSALVCGVILMSTAVFASGSALMPVPKASAVTATGWAQWEPLTGSAGSWTTRMQLPAAGFPSATVRSDSRGGQVGVQSGASSWLSTATPPGALFGSSRDNPYLNLRPRADNPTAPSTTTYTFERPTPVGSWAFVLGDIDADRAVVSARGADGRLLAGAELGWQGGFNYCAVTPSPSCSGDPGDIAFWDPATGEVTGNAAAIDSSGAAGWFQPTVSVTSLTIMFYQRSGLPVYQTWFASIARDISGTVPVVDASGVPTGDVVAGATLTLLGPDGTVLATTTSGSDGTYVFSGYAAADGYSVELTALPPAGGAFPFGLVPFGQDLVTGVDISQTDATDVQLPARQIVPIAVSGTITDTAGNPLRGAVVALTPVGGGTAKTATTNSLGQYTIDDVSWDTTGTLQPQEYTFSLQQLPAGYTEVSGPPDIVVGVGDEAPSTGNDFVVRAAASLSGVVTAAGSPVSGISVTVSGSSGTVTAVTVEDGSYVVPGLLPGTYTATITPSDLPNGYSIEGPATRTVTVSEDNVTGVEFALSRTGSLGGTITDVSGSPVSGAKLTITGPQGTNRLAADTGGKYFLDKLPPGKYTITLTVPDGYTAITTVLTATITAAGEQLLAEDFSLTKSAPLGTASGTVTDTAGVPVSDARIIVTDKQGNPVANVTTAADGTWRAALPDGSYSARITVPSGYAAQGQTQVAFAIVDGASVTVNFVLAIAPVPNPQPGTKPGHLPDTGSSSIPLLLTGFILSALGAVALSARRARNRGSGSARHEHEWAFPGDSQTPDLH